MKLSNSVRDEINLFTKKFQGNLLELCDKFEEEIQEDYGWKLQNSFLNNCKLENQILELQDKVETLEQSVPTELYSTTPSLEHEMKMEWWRAACGKYTLVQLESIFGNRFNLKEFKDVDRTKEIVELSELKKAIDELLNKLEKLLNE